MADSPCQHDGPEVLLVEGKDDCHVVLALCGVLRVPENFGIYDCGSDMGVLRRLSALIAKEQHPRVIGVVLDADLPDVSGRWQSITAKLKPYNYVLPLNPSVGGTIIDPSADLPRLGFWLMPNNRDIGMLEDFCQEMIPLTCVSVVNRCIAIAEADECTTFKEAHRTKAVVHTYLAWQDEPGRPLGTSITAEVLRPNTQSARDFADWLTKLFAA
ncbi:MAG: DUF3226 domain-containing protein [Capsulimonadaceae bacterium]